MPEPARNSDDKDGARATLFFLLHAGIFILVPLVVAGIAIWWQFG